MVTDVISSNAYLHIVGLGVAEKAELPSASRQVLINANVIIGSERQLSTIEPLLSEIGGPPDSDLRPNCVLLPKLKELKAYIDQYRGKQIVILASGDPLYYGIGRWCMRHFQREDIIFYPAVSSIQWACSALGFALQDVDVLSLHGRPFEKIRSGLKSNQTMLVLTDQHSTPQVLAKECIAANFNQSVIWVCEKLGYKQQQIRQFKASELAVKVDIKFDALHVTVIQTLGEGGVLPEFPGIPDTHFSTGAEPGKGMITKREIRLVVLSLMQPANEDVIWDVGAGCGGVAIELSYWNERVTVYAIEHNTERLRHLKINRTQFGVSDNLNVVSGRAPDACSELPQPNKIFIGGSDGEMPVLLAKFWQRLPINGLLVASAVTEETKSSLVTFAESLLAEQVECVELAVNKGFLIDDSKMNYQTKLPVSLFKFKKKLMRKTWS